MTSDTELSVEENLLIFSKLYGVPRARRKKLIDELLSAYRLTALGYRKDGYDTEGK